MLQQTRSAPVQDQVTIEDVSLICFGGGVHVSRTVLMMVGYIVIIIIILVINLDIIFDWGIIFVFDIVIGWIKGRNILFTSEGILPSILLN